MSDRKSPDIPPSPPENEETIFNPEVRAPPLPPPPPATTTGNIEDPPLGEDPWVAAERATPPWNEEKETADAADDLTSFDQPEGATRGAADEPPLDSSSEKAWGRAPEPVPVMAPTTPPAAATISGLRNTPMNPEPHAQCIKVGDVLNHIFEVKRFIARGGMGEVFEAMNVNSDERVAVKVMLPSLAADPNVIALFRREARTMTRLQHEALVQYRVLAQEPVLGVLYIVTEFIDGVSLGDVLGTINANADDLEMLLRRLASGLRAAHSLGVLHRDISPDNVLLEGGRLSSAKVVDFGIAKDLNPGSATIIGDGFAGKLGYVAPEQLGDFNRELGPWTDVYSLGLVILAAAIGRDVMMGGTLVDAVDKRRSGPDISSVPERIRPVLEGMLKANPTERMRSMDELLEALDKVQPSTAPPQPPSTSTESAARNKRKFVVVGVAGIVLLGSAAAWLSSGGSEDGADSSVTAAANETVSTIRADDPVDTARDAINSAIPSISCSWLDIVTVRKGGGQVNIAMGGVAGSPAAALAEISKALSSSNLANANIDFASVAPVQPGGCAALDAYRQIRNLEATRLATDQRKWEIRKHDYSLRPTDQVARVIIRISTPGEAEDFTLFGIEPSGKFSEMLDGRNAFEAAAAKKGTGVTKRGSEGYNIQLDADHQGWSGLILLTGKGPFASGLLRPDLGARNIAWKERLAQTATERGWKADMLWVNTVNERPGD